MVINDTFSVTCTVHHIQTANYRHGVSGNKCDSFLRGRSRAVTTTSTFQSTVQSGNTSQIWRLDAVTSGNVVFEGYYAESTVVETHLNFIRVGKQLQQQQKKVRDWVCNLFFLLSERSLRRSLRSSRSNVSQTSRTCFSPTQILSTQRLETEQA